MIKNTFFIIKIFYLSYLYIFLKKNLINYFVYIKKKLNLNYKQI